MPFGVSWGQYLSMWGVCVIGFACGSQIVHSIYQPMNNIDKAVEAEVKRLREENGLIKPTFEDKMKKMFTYDQEYVKLFGINAPKKEN